MIVQWSRVSTALGATDTLAVDRDGRFGALARQPLSDSIVVLVEPVERDRYYPARVVLPPERVTQDIHLLLIPRRWTIRGGGFAGRSIAIDPAAALRRAPDRGSFGRLHAQRIVGWMPGSFPIPVVLRRDDGLWISPADSSAFWAAAQDVNDALGGAFLRPWSDTAAVGRVFPIDVRIDRRIPAAAITFITWNGDGEVFEGSIRFRSSAEMRDPGVVEHELLHVLGFGHTASWPSVMTARATRITLLTAEDVAYAQFLMRVHALQEDPFVVGEMRSN